MILSRRHAQRLRGDLREHRVGAGAHVRCAHLQEERAVLVHLEERRGPVDARDAAALHGAGHADAALQVAVRRWAATCASAPSRSPRAPRSMHSGRPQLRITRGSPSLPSPSCGGEHVDVAQPDHVLAPELDGSMPSSCAISSTSVSCAKKPCGQP